jgi:hypothetical protein
MTRNSAPRERSVADHRTGPPDSGRPRPEPAPAAATAALALVAIDVNLFPTVPIGLAGALLNEWLFWFMVLYLLLVGLTALTQRVTRTGGVSTAGAASSASEGSTSW